MSQRTGELPQDYLNRIIKIFVSRVDLSNEDLKITYTLTKKTAIPHGTAVNSATNKERIIELNPCSTVAFSGGADGSRTHVRKEIS